MDVQRPASGGGGDAGAGVAASVARSVPSSSPPASPGRAAAAFASSPHTSLTMDESVKDALLCGNNF
jgi:hypothetical protein